MPDHARDKALVFTGPVLYYYISDHLGTPQMVVDAEGQVMWQGDYLPFGEVIVTADEVGNSIRFPGQYFDAETGLHYNWHRYYDPATGRYISADPIGLAGGINLYAYVGGDPVNAVGPWGLRVYRGPGLPRPNNLPWDKGPQRGPGGSSSGCDRPQRIWICDDMCCDWDECNKICRYRCPIIYSASSRPPVKKCLSGHWAWITRCGDKVYGHYSE